MLNQNIRGSQKTKTFVYLWIGSRHMLSLAKASEEGRIYTCTASLLLSAFMIEAYLNHLGSLRNKEWEKIERKIPKLEKYKIFSEAVNIPFDQNRQQHKSLLDLFKFRDSMAHSKTITDIIDTQLETQLPMSIIPSTAWQKFATLENAEQASDDSIILIRELHQANGYKKDPFTSAGRGVYFR